jgi:hypothetical protein
VKREALAPGWSTENIPPWLEFEFVKFVKIRGVFA